MRNPQDLLAGLLFASFGAAALWFGRTLAIGSATKMGPGYLPTILGWSLIAFGVLIGGRALVTSGKAIPRIRLRPQVLIILALVAFALTIERFGLLPATIAVVLLGSAASPDVRIHEALILAVGAALAAVGLFIYLLGQPMAPWIWNI